MSQLLLNDLRNELRANKVVAVIGTGISVAATARHKLATWTGLLENGIERCIDLQRVTDDWIDLRLRQINTNDPFEFIAAADLITIALGGTRSAEFALWLRESVGGLQNKIRDRSLLHALGRLPFTLLMTTNYDGLLEVETGLQPLTWKQWQKLDELIRGKRKAVFHLHGYWDEPESVVLGTTSYHDVTHDMHAQEGLRALLATQTLLFVGVGLEGGLQDPNLGALRQWINLVYSTSTTRHYVLVRDCELQNALTLLPLSGRLQPITYGAEHADLPTFLESFLPEAFQVHGKNHIFVPSPPEPYFAHPYPMQRNFTGRAQERQKLTTWAKQSEAPVLVIDAIGGMGKTALTWYWTRMDVPVLGLSSVAQLQETPPPYFDAVMWWSFYEPEATFADFVNHSLRYLTREENSKELTSSEKVRRLTNIMSKRDKRTLIVLDGFERELRAYAGTSAAYQGDEFIENGVRHERDCIDDNARKFLVAMTTLTNGSRVLLTSRLRPRPLDDLEGYDYLKLEGMSDNDLVTFFSNCGICGTRAEKLAAGAPYGNHPLAVRLLAGIILHDARNPGDILVAKNYPILPELKGKEKHHILQVAYATMQPSTQLLLRACPKIHDT